MAKDNILTGKTETVGALGSSKISGFGAGLLKGFKPSKFVKPSDCKENLWLNYPYLSEIIIIFFSEYIIILMLLQLLNCPSHP